MKIFFDENFSHHLSGGLHRFQEGAKREGMEVIHVSELFGRGMADEDWIPKVAKAHGVVLSQDFNIHRTPYLWRLCVDCKVGFFFFRPSKKTPCRYWDWVNWTMTHWNVIKRLSSEENRPFAFEITPRCNEPQRLANWCPSDAVVGGRNISVLRG